MTTYTFDTGHGNAEVICPDTTTKDLAFLIAHEVCEMLETTSDISEFDAIRQMCHDNKAVPISIETEEMIISFG